MMPGELKVARVEGRLLAPAMPQGGDLAVVDDDLGGHAPEEEEGVVMGAQEVLLALAQGELDVQAPADAEDHDEEGRAATGVADLEKAGRTPVDLGGLPGGELEAQEGLTGAGSDPGNMGAQDGGAAGIPLLTQEAEDLAGGVVMAVEEPGDGGLEGLELAGPWRGLALRVGGPLGPSRDGLDVELELAGDLGQAQAIPVPHLMDAAEEVVGDHRTPPG